MAYRMKRGNSKISYQDLMSESNQAMTDATEAERKADVESSALNLKKELEAGTDRVTPASSKLKYEKNPEDFIKRKSGPKVDPDAPGEPGTPGYEPEVKSTDYLEKLPTGPRAKKKNIKEETHNEAALRTEGPKKVQYARRNIRTGTINE